MVTNERKKFKTGFLIGRFQPFHKGHLHLMNESFQYVDEIIVGVGSIGKIDQDNFLNYEQRKEVLQSVIKKERVNDRVKKIIPLQDFNNDRLWLKNSLSLAGKFEIVIGNNEWTNGIFERAGYPVLRLGFYKRYLYEGIKIRNLIKTGGEWEGRIPSYIVKLLSGYITNNETVKK